MASESTTVRAYLAGSTIRPLFLAGDAQAVLRTFPDASVDCCMTSPPYWGQRTYAAGGLGSEDDPQDFITALTSIFGELHRVLKPTGSVWLNIGDSYRRKGLLNLPWRLAITLTDTQGWIL